MTSSDERDDIIDGPVVQGGGRTGDGQPIGTEIGGGRATGGAGRGSGPGTGPGGTTGGPTGGEGDPRQGPEWDADAVDESGDIDDVGRTERGEPGPGDQRDDPEERSRAFEDQSESSW